jgi:crossover junction endodeoxyribonuclease RuvC
MIIIGIDPGTICTGYGVVKFHNSELSYVTSGLIKLPPVKSLAPRLELIYNELDKIIKHYKPKEFSIETAFYGKNVQSAMKIGYARGVSILAATHNGLSLGEYSPREIKKAVVGRGTASKEQVQYMIKKLLALRKDNMKLDESDALAVAICHAFKGTKNTSSGINWKDFVNANPDKVISN